MRKILLFLKCRLPKELLVFGYILWQAHLVQAQAPISVGSVIDTIPQQGKTANVFTLKGRNKFWQTGGPFDGRSPNNELINLRTECSKKFIRQDGKIDVIIGGPFHYKDEHGSLQEINLTIKESADTLYPFINYENQFIAQFGKTDREGVRLNYKNAELTFGRNIRIGSSGYHLLHTTNNSALTNENKIVHENVFEKVNLKYQVEADKVLHQLIFTNRNVFNRFSSSEYITVEEEIQLPTNAVLRDSLGIINQDRNTAGPVYVVSSGDFLFTIQPSRIWDSSYNSIGINAEPNVNNVLLIQSSIKSLPGNKVIYISKIPVNWLLSPSRLYPITLDPDIYLGNVSNPTLTYPYPFNTCRYQRVSQTLFRQSDIGVSGTITAIRFYQISPNPNISYNINIGLKDVTYSDMSISGSALETGITNCYSYNPGFTFNNTNNWWIFNLTSSFIHSNTNLLVEAKFNNCGQAVTSSCLGSCPPTFSTGGNWGSFNATYNAHRWAYSNNSSCSFSPPTGNICPSTEGNPAFGPNTPGVMITINPSCTPVSNGSTQPQNQTITSGSSATFNVSVNGTPPYSYFWYKNGVYTGISTQNTSSTINTYTTPPLTYPGDNGSTYFCLITNCSSLQQTQSNVATVTINSSCATINAPTGLSATAIPAGPISLSWLDNSNNEEYFEIQRSLTVSGPFTSIGITSGPGITSVQDNSVVGGTTYYYRIRAWCSSNASAFSNIASATAINSPPHADFYSNMNNIRPGTAVMFYDNSSNATSYSWSFPGGTPSSYNGQFPSSITYTTPGVFTVTLTVNNSQGPASPMVKTAYIRVAPDGTNQVIPPPSTAIGIRNQQCTLAEPIQVGTSTYEYSHTDFTIPIINNKIQFTRFYNSLNSSQDGALGYGWSHSYNFSITNENLQDSTWTVRYPDGHIEKFIPLYNQSQVYPWTSFGLYSGTVDSLVKPDASTYVLFAKDNKQYSFNSSGQLVQIKDLNNNVVVLTYSGANLSAVVGQGGRSLSINYDANNRISSVTDPLNRNCVFNYDGSGNLISATDARLNTISFAYDANHLITSIVNPLQDTIVANIYDGQNRIISQRDAYNKTTSITYNTPAVGDATITNPDNSVIVVHHDSFYRQTSYKDELGHTRLYGYDNFSNQVSFTNENGNTESRMYDNHANDTVQIRPDNSSIRSMYNLRNTLTHLTDANGNSTQFNYNVLTNNLGSIQFADNTTNNFSYNANGLLTTFTDGRNNTTTNTYLTTGDLVSTARPIGIKTYGYDAAGRLTSVTNENLQTSVMVYDNNDNITSITDALGRTILYTYDANNQLLSVTDKMGYHTFYSYDKKGRLLTKTDAKGGIIRYQYNSRDNLVTVTDQRGHRIAFTYDLRGRKITDSTAMGLTHYEYDNAGNLKKITDPTNRSITYSYTNTNRVSSIKDGLNNTTTFTYDNNGSLKTTVNPLNKTTTNSYDVMNRLVGVLDALYHTTSMTYDENGNRTSVTDPNGHLQQYTYDANGRLSGYVDGASNAYSYTYDALGNNLTISKPTGVMTKAYDAGNRLMSLIRSVGGTDNFQYDNNDNITQMSNGAGYSTMTYDSLNQMVQYVNPQNKTVSFAYDATGNKTSITYPGNNTVNYTYDASSNLITVTDWLSHTFMYTYDSAGRNTQLVYPNGITAKFLYDGAARLTEKKTITSTNSIVAKSTFTLDASGNRINEVRSGNLSPAIPPVSNFYTYGNDDRMLSNGVWNYSNDNAGNRIAETNQTISAGYEFTTDNRLISFTDTTGLLTNYSYDPLGHRLSRINSALGTEYVLDLSDGLSKVLQMTDSNGVVKSQYIYGVGLLERIDSANNSLFYHFDAQHNTVALTDMTDSVYDKYAYDPFGVILSHSGITEQPFTFLGEFGVEKESKSFFYVRERYYDAGNGRFISKDFYPFDFNNPQTINRYIYSNNNPGNYFDYTGLWPNWNTIGQSAIDLGKTALNLAGGIVMGFVAGGEYAVSDALDGSSTAYSALELINNAAKNSVGFLGNFTYGLLGHEKIPDSWYVGPFDPFYESRVGQVTTHLNDAYGLISLPKATSNLFTGKTELLSSKLITSYPSLASFKNFGLLVGFDIGKLSANVKGLFDDWQSLKGTGNFIANQILQFKNIFKNCGN